VSPSLLDPIRAVFQSPQLQIAGSLGTLFGLALVGYLVVKAGRPLKRRHDARLVELLQAAVMLSLTGLAGTVIVAAWRATDEVRRALAQMGLGVREAVLVVVTVLVLFGAYSLTVLIKRTIDTFFRRQDAISRHQREVAYHLAQVGIYLFAVLLVFSIWGINLGNLLLGAGVLGIVVGLAARQTLSAVLAGFVLLFSRPFAIGDWVQIDDREGYVVDVSIFNTEIRTFQDEHVVIPNDVVTGSSLVNRSRRGRLRIDLEAGIRYEDDPNVAAEAAQTAMAGVEGVADDPEPAVVLKRFDDSAVILECRFWITTPTAEKRWTAQTAVITAIGEAFEDAGVEIPFPQRELAASDDATGLRLSGPVAGPPQADETEDSDAEDRRDGTSEATPDTED